MSFEGMNMEFGSEEDLPSGGYEKRRVPEGTVAGVKVRPDRDGNLGEFKSGESQYGPWMVVPFEIVDGEFAGEWCSMIMTVKPEDRRFRKIVEVVTGTDISSGGSLSFEDFRDKLIAGVFKAELGPETRKNDAGEPEETGYTKVFKLEERVGDREDSPADSGASDQDAPALDDEGDEDVPF